MTSSVSTTTSTADDVSQQIAFNYANECDLEIHCSPFGLSGLYIRINGTNLMGIGSTMGLITGSTKGLIHYNDSNDFIDQKYKLYVIVDDEGMLRIDFTKIFTLKKKDNKSKSKSKLKSKLKSKSKSTTGKKKKSVDDDKDNDGDIKKKKKGGKSKDDKSKGGDDDEEDDEEEEEDDDEDDDIEEEDEDEEGHEDDDDADDEKEEDKYEEEEVPTLIFRGKCPEGRPDHIEPFIGIFSFER
ncbi:hypothetical protein DFJ63DRAFT_242207 [Scheffersomyces coipomensis]|uniref:uncharacterized protein n=1 Tax=Scheffersomyces coipomensis TaxID=1788519 RepID=UPI00315D9B6F